jgi:hypothetical protein
MIMPRYLDSPGRLCLQSRVLGKFPRNQGTGLGKL